MTAAHTDLPDGVQTLNGKLYRTDAKGALVPDELVKAQDKLQDETVRRMFAAARELHDAMAAFKDTAFGDVDALNALLEQQYGAKARVGGVKGNITISTFDGLMTVKVQVSDQIQFGPELQVAKDLVDECVNEWAADSGAEIRAIVTHAFRVDREGQINRGALLQLLRLDIKDERWQHAMEAIKDSMKVVGSSRYIRFYEKANTAGPMIPLSLDLATV